MKIGFLGAGGLGGFLAAVLQRAGHEVLAFDRGEHAARIRQYGLQVTEVDGSFMARPRMVERASELAGAESVFITVKAYALPPLVPDVRRLASGGCSIVPLLNGVEALAELQGAGLPEKRLLGGVAYLTAFKTAPGAIERQGRHARLIVGAPSGATTPELERLVSAFEGTGIQVAISEDIELELWRKMVLTCTLAAACVLEGSTVGPIRARAAGRTLLERAATEVVDVGRSLGIGLEARDAAHVLDLLDKLPSDFYPSLLHDLRSGRRTEVDVLSAVISRWGRKTGVPTPTHDAVTSVLKA